MAPNDPVAFPSGVYGKYKRATQFFLDWLLRARGHGLGDSATNRSSRVTLDTFHNVVDAIAKAPTSQLSPVLLHQMPRALAACQSSITLRERVAQFFTSDTKSLAKEDSHAHFLNRLKKWLAILKQVDDATMLKTPDANKTQKQHRDEVGDRARFTNYYEVLRIPDDFFPDAVLGMEFSAATTTDATPRGLSDAEREQLFDAAFEQDMQMELVCFLIELEDMAEQVYATYCEVKWQSRTLVEASAVVYAAMLVAQSRVASLQLRYPAIRDAQDVLTLLQSRMTQDMSHKLADTLATAIHSGTTDHIPGLFLADFMWVTSALLTFTSAIPSDKSQKLILKDEHFGDNYDEEFTPHYVVPDISKHSTFLMQQLPLLYNTLLAWRHAKPNVRVVATDSPPDSFLAVLDEYFTSQRVGVHVVFACICWIKSVAGLQGAGALKRNVGWTLARSRDVEKRLQASVEKGEVRKADRELHEAMQATLQDLNSRRRAGQRGDSSRRILHANPMLAGYMMLYDQFRFLNIGGESVVVTARLRAFLHLYHALVDRQLLQKIPLIEELLEVYGEVMFTPTRAASVHGSYSRTYLLSSHMTAIAVDAMFRGAPQPAKHASFKVRDCFHLRDLSATFRLMVEQDLSVLATTPSEPLTLKDQLVRVADQCAKEVRMTRVLSRDMLKLSDVLTDVFEALCDGLGRRWYHDQYLATPEPGVSRQYMVNRALEDAVMVPLMLFLDCLNLDKTVDTSKLLRTEAVSKSGVEDDGIARYCERAAAIITRRFASRDVTAAVIESTYYTLPRYTNGFTREVGDRDFKQKVHNPMREEHFCGLMDMLEDCDGGLTEDDVRELKATIKQDPEVMVMVSCSDELSTLFHHVAAGPARDPALVEWFIQMGALFWQPAGHFRSQQQFRGGRSNAIARINSLAVHSAAAAGHVDAVLLILEADNYRDLNTPTYSTKETLVHLAVKNGHRELYKMLAAAGADLRGRDANGRRVSDLTSDKDWKREILTVIARQEREYEQPPAKNREPQFRRAQDLQAERLRESVASQRDHERTGKSSGALSQPAPLAASGNQTGGSSKKKKKGGNKKKNKSKHKTNTGESNTAAGATVGAASSGFIMGASSDSGTRADGDHNAGSTTSLLQDLRLGSTPLAPGLADDIEQQVTDFQQSTATLARAFASLKDVSTTTPATSEQDQVAETAMATLERLYGFIGMLRHPDRLNATPRHARLMFATAAYDAIHLMNKFDRAAQTKVATDASTIAADTTGVDKLRQKCRMQDYLVGFITGTAHVLASCDRTTQARELLDVAEKRLLKLQERPDEKFGSWVQLYVHTRSVCGLGQASSAQALGQLESYLHETAPPPPAAPVSSAAASSSIPSRATDGKDTVSRILEDLELHATGLGPALAKELESRLADLHQCGANFERALASLQSVGVSVATPQQKQAAATALAHVERVQKFSELLGQPAQVATMPQNVQQQFAAIAYEAICALHAFEPASQAKVATRSAATASVVEKLRQSCLMQDALIQWITGTATLLASCSDKTRARELLDICEQRLLRLDERPLDKFRPWVKLYAQTRKSCGFGETSGRAALRQLHFYIHDFAPKDPEFMLQMDGLYGHRGFFAITCKDGQRAFNRFCRAFRKYPGTDNVLLFSEQIVYACDTSEELRNVLGAHMAASKETNVDWISESFMSRVPSIQIEQYEFSKTGIVLVDM